MSKGRPDGNIAEVPPAGPLCLTGRIRVEVGGEIVADTDDVALCRCGHSGDKPFCDGSHKVTSITPREITVDEPRTMAICACWRSKTRPYCDGTHGKLVASK